MKEKMIFSKGQKVEVLNNEKGLKDSWFVATILSLPKSVRTTCEQRFFVEYEKLHGESQNKPLKESIKFSRLRPLPPRETVPRKFRLEEEVDVLFNDAWWKGVIKEIVSGGSKYSVFFNSTNEECYYNQNELRTHLDWTDGKWVKSQNQVQVTMESIEVKLSDENCDGAWIPATLLEKISDSSFLVTYKRFESGEEVEEMREVSLIDIRTPPPQSSHENANGCAPSTDMATPRTISRLRDVSKELSSRNKCIRVDKQLIPHETDSPASVFKTMRDRAVNKGPTLKACHPKGANLADAQDAFSFRSTKYQEKEQDGVPPTGQIKEDLCSSGSKLPEVGRLETETVSLKRENPINSFKRSKRRKAEAQPASQPKDKETASPEVAIFQTDHAPMLSHTDKEHLDVSNLLEGGVKKTKSKKAEAQPASQPKGPDHETASKEVAIVDTEHAQMLSLTDKEHLEVFNLPDGGGVLTQTDDVEITPTDSSTETFAFWGVSDNLPSSLMEEDTTSDGQCHSDNANGDDRSMHLVTTATAIPSSPKQQDEQLPFMKNVWETIGSLEIFQLMPQQPHFSPLQQENAFHREGLAVGNMLGFANLAGRLRRVNIEEPKTMLENMLNALADYEKLGFTVLPLQTQIKGMLALKDNYVQLHDDSKLVESGLIAERSKLDKHGASISKMEKELQTAKMEQENIVSNLAEQQRTLDGISKSIQKVKSDFDL